MQAQIRITKTPQLATALNYIKSKYFLLDDVEIIKMAISNQYNSLQQSGVASDIVDETDYLLSSPNNAKSLKAAIAQDISTARRFESLDDLKKALKYQD
jgi:hypothetical protein